MTIPAPIGTPTTGDSASPISTITITMPGSIAVGELLVSVIEIWGGSSTTITAPAGWDLVGRASNDVTSFISTAAYSRIATGSEASTYDWTLSATSNNSSWQCYRVSGQGSVFTDVSVTTNTGNTTVAQPTSTGVTTVTDGCLVMSIMGAGSSSTAITAPGGWTNITGGQNGGRAWRHTYISQTSRGASGDAVGSGMTLDRSWACLMWAVRAEQQPTTTRWQGVPHAGARIQRIGV
jgi:hypothetical protein